MSDFFIPPPGLAFRLLGRRSNRVLVANPNDTLTDYELGDIYGDQWFTLENAPPIERYMTEGYMYPDRWATLEKPPPIKQFFIKSTSPANHGKVIFCRAAADEVGIYRKDYDDQHFVLESGCGDFLGNFRLYAPSARRVITAQAKPNTVLNAPANDEKYDDQYFSFLFEDTEIVRVEYDIANARPIGTMPITYPVELTNRGNGTAKLVANMSRTVSETSSFEFHQGFTISVGASFKAGIPCIAEGEIKTEVSTSTDFTWGKASTTEMQVGSSVEIEVPPRSSQQVVASYKRSTVNLTATIYSKSKSTGVEVITKTQYKGTPVWGYNYTVQEAKPLHG